VHAERIAHFDLIAPHDTRLKVNPGRRPIQHAKRTIVNGLISWVFSCFLICSPRAGAEAPTTLEATAFTAELAVVEDLLSMLTLLSALLRAAMTTVS
jgi:hypothetical protein